jgi:hypothetical protein
MARRLRDDSGELYVQVAQHARAAARSNGADHAGSREERPNA